MTSKIKIMLLVQGIILLAGTITTAIILLTFSRDCNILVTYDMLCPSCGGRAMVENVATGNIITAFIAHPIYFIGITYLLVLNVIFIINSFREKPICKWIYPKISYLIVFIILLAIFTVVRNIV